ncbi:hypothetical protein [Nodularia sp. NIES-3585]|uniref:hypothetical protein n=1 Tax=Nodularia sp. NIES-3585 TaxID=1973477 RepID=UPI000B717120|nr:hypothetical protein [Nodularia sp. NIES-3585]GAX38954.1 hypothetical protein NIES3585_50060 [Nodularia sp. NIES-3585]
MRLKVTIKKKRRKSLSLPRFQPMENTPLALVADYLNSLEATEAKKLLSEMLVMYFLPRAQYNLGGCSQQEITNSYLIARRMAESHFGIMALELGLDASVYGCVSVPFSPGATQGYAPQGGMQRASSPAQSPVEPEEEDHQSSLIAGEASGDFMDQLFG